MRILLILSLVSHITISGAAFDVRTRKRRNIRLTRNNDTQMSAESANEAVVFPPPLTPVDRLKRAATFWASALTSIAGYYSFMGTLPFRSEDDDVEALWAEQHARAAHELARVITELKGFYVKSAQIVSTRQDLFPKEYTDALSKFTDSLDPMPTSMARAVVEQELHLPFDDVFCEFDENPLGAASVAQVHRAVLTEAYGNKVVAVKIQRPSIEAKLLGDISNLKALSKALAPILPLDYYKVFSELETQLADEFDFIAEAGAMERIASSLQVSPLTGRPRPADLFIPLPVEGLVTRRVLVMDYLDGIPLSRLRDQSTVDPNSPQSKLFGRQLLSALTTAFGRSILETGFFHADPHPGNIMLLKDGRIGLVDFGQHKQISEEKRISLAKVMVGLAERGKEVTPEARDLVTALCLELGVELKADAPLEAATAIAIWLFDGSTTELPGGYDPGELSPNSPVRALKSFPQDLVLVGRSSVLIRGLSTRLGIPWSLCRVWAPIAREVLDDKEQTGEAASCGKSRISGRLSLAWVSLRQRCRVATLRVVKRLPAQVQARLAWIVLRLR